MASPEASTTSKWTTESPARSSNPAVSAFSMGANVAAGLTAFEQVLQLERDVTLARGYYNENSKDFNFWERGVLSESVDNDGFLLPNPPTAPAGTFQGYKKYLGDSLAESRNRPYYTAGTYTPQFGQLDYRAAVGRGQSKAAFQLDREWLNTRRKVGRYNVGHGRRVDYKFAIARFNSELEGWNLGFRFEDNRKMMYDEQRHAHQAEILNIGIHVGNAAREGLATSVKGLSEVRAQKAGQFGQLSNGLATMAGREQFTQDLKNYREKYDVKDYNKGREGKAGEVEQSNENLNRAANVA
jgi:hypothetical protein